MDDNKHPGTLVTEEQIAEAQGRRVDSTSDERTTNNVARHEYRVLSDEEKAAMKRVKDAGTALIETIRDSCPAGRETSLGITNAEQAIMWAVKGLTA